MNPTETKTIFVSGTDTDVGKTYAASLLAKSLVSSGVNVAVYKPVASGCAVQVDGQIAQNDNLIAEDAVQLWESAGKPGSLSDVCPQKFLAPLAPTQAAKLEGKNVDAAELYAGANRWRTSYDILIVEGAGGLLSPLADGVLNIDLCKQFVNAHLIIVAANRLGVIHQTLATCAAAMQHGVKPAGIILCSVNSVCDDSIKSNATEIASYTNVPILAEIGYRQESLRVSWVDSLF